MFTVLAGYYTYHNFICDDNISVKQVSEQSIVGEKEIIKSDNFEDTLEKVGSQNISLVEKKIEKVIEESKPIPDAKKKVKITPKKKVKRKKKVAVPKLAAIQFEKLMYDFGEITEGEIKEFEFKFTTTGKIPLEILEAHATCGCTTPTVPFISIKPGESNAIGITYNSVNKEGPQNPEITIKTNTYPAVHIIKLKGTVLKKENEDGMAEDAELDETKVKTNSENDSLIKPNQVKERVKKNSSMKIGIKKDTVK